MLFSLLSFALRQLSRSCAAKPNMGEVPAAIS